MKNSTPFYVLMDGLNKRFVIPVYQRHYDWTIGNCQQLLDDIARVIAENRESHFFGCVVASTEGPTYTVIDGQQRLTTVTLMLLALVHLIRDGQIACETSYLADQIEDGCLRNKYSEDGYKLKLKPAKDDMRAFGRLYGPEEDFIKESQVTTNYRFFKTSIPKLGVTADCLFDAFKKLEIIEIILDPFDNPQLIFESLNSTGKDLTEADKIRNYVLMGLPLKQQEELYESYWRKIEDETGDETSEFIRHYLTFKQRKWPNISSVYQVFKRFAPPDPASMRPLLETMIEFARYSRQIRTASTKHRDIDVVLARIGRLDSTVVYPYFFALFESWNAGELSDADVVKSLRVIENYLFRRLISEIPSQALNKIFAALQADVLRLIGDEGMSSYVDALKYVLLTKTASGRFPSDEEFEGKIRSKDFYNLRQKTRVYCFDRLENGDSKDIVDVPGRMLDDKGSLSVEHIMPQSPPTPAWKNELGPDWERIHAEWKHKIANLTITGFNSEYSNRPFLEKLAAKDGYADSPYRLNKWIAEQKTWGKPEMQKREDLLVKRFLELWPKPETSFTPKADERAEHSLDDDFDFTGSNPAAYLIMGERYPARNWKEAVAAVLIQLVDIEPAKIIAFARSDASGSMLRVSAAIEHGWTNVGQEVQAYLATSTSSKMSLLSSVCDAVGLDKAEISFELRGESEQQQ